MGVPTWSRTSPAPGRMIGSPRPGLRPCRYPAVGYGRAVWDQLARISSGATPPPSLDSPAFTAAFNQMKEIGALNRSTRTPEQTDIARYWAGPSGTVQPPGHWNSIARGVADAQGNSLEENARMFALLNIGMADALITAWDTKFNYNFVRPVTAIRNADNDGNPDTAADPTWSPLLTTPAHPSYMAAHSAVSATAATVLADFFGNDAIAFTSSAEPAAAGQSSLAPSTASRRRRRKRAPAGSTAASTGRSTTRPDSRPATPSASSWPTTCCSPGQFRARRQSPWRWRSAAQCTQ